MSLQVREDFYRILVEGAEEGIWVIDAEGRTSLVNAKMAGILGYEIDEMMGRPLFAVMDAEGQRAAQQLLQRRREGIRERHQFTFQRKDGTSVTASIATNPIFDEGGRYAGALALVADITEQTQLQERLKQSETRLELALAASRQGLWDWNLAANHTYLSPTYWALTGYTEGEVRADLAFFTSLIHPQDRPAVEKTMQEHLRGESPLSVIEYRMRRKTGEYIWMRGIGRVTERDGTGAPVRMVGVVYDISERKRFEQEQAFLSRAGAVLSSSLDYEQTMATIATIAVGDFADWCAVDLVDERAGLMRLKVACADPTRAGLCARLEQLPPDRGQHHLARAVLEMRRPLLLEHVTQRDIETYAQGPDHLQALMEVGARSMVAVPLLRKGQALGVLVFVSSTASRVYGAGDLWFAAALAERAALAIENARLYRDSVDAARLRDDVLSVVAHDLRNPLATIVMQASLLMQSQPPAERGPAQGIHRAATRMSRLIQDLLDIGLLETGKLQMEKVGLRPRDLVAEAGAALGPLAASSSIELRTDLADDIPDLCADRDRLLEVLDNLIGNAIKFTAPGGRVTVGGAARQHEVVFWVRDSGCGIAPDALPHVFDRFWQAKKADRRGAGLGLYIAKGIVEAHGGRIWVESAVHEGSTFFFTIPTGART
jgi:PAS domain S-box-containing protein